MRKVMFLLVIAIIFAASAVFGQLTLQDEEQINILKSQIYQQKVILAKAQNKLKELKTLEMTVISIDSLVKEYEDATSLSGVERRILARNKSNRLQAKTKILEIKMENPNLEQKIADEQSKLDELQAQKEQILARATGNQGTPVEVGMREQKLRNRGFEVKTKDADVNYKIKLQEEALRRLSGKATPTDSVNGPYTILLINYSNVNARSFTVKGIEGTRAYILEPNQTMVISALPQMYYCDIVDIVSSNARYNNFAEVGLQTKYAKGIKASAIFYAPKYL